MTPDMWHYGSAWGRYGFGGLYWSDAYSTFYPRTKKTRRRPNRAIERAASKATNRARRAQADTTRRQQRAPKAHKAR